MPDCDYCDRSFDDASGYHDHLRYDHPDELDRIDQRRVATEDDSGLPTGPLALGLIFLVAVAVVGYVVLVSGSGESGNQAGPSDLGAVHFHGTMRVIIAGQAIDFSQSKYQLQADAFHFESKDGRRWHVHARDVTLAWAMDSLGISITADTVSIGERTYDDANPDTTVRVIVNDEPVTPSTYILQRGDAVRIVVEIE